MDEEETGHVAFDYLARPRLWLLRHGQTEWSKSGQHTGLTDIPLTEKGEEQAAAARPKLADVHFDLVLASPYQRAIRTAELAGFDRVTEEPEAHEWDYGDYEGISSEQVRKDRPGWLIWNDGVPNGETINQVAGRADTVIARVLALQKSGQHPDAVKNVLLVAHGHFLRVLTARWLKMAPGAGRHFVLGTGSVSRLGWDKRTPGIEKLNA